MTQMLLAGIALKSAAVLGIAWLVARALRSRSAAARHMVWTAAMAMLVALPLLSVSLPSWGVPGTEALFQVTASDSGSPQAAPAPTPAQKGAEGEAPTRPWRPDWIAAAGTAWAAGTVFLLGRLLLSWMFVRSVRSRASKLTMVEGVEIVESGSTTMPMALGILKPAVVMPACASDWNEERRDLVLRHELAHVRRGDVATQTIARIATSAYWWNPLVWTAWKEFVKERERAADDAVLASGASASGYASHLLEIARGFRTPAAFASGAVAMARPSELEGRLIAILDSGVPRSAPGRKAILATAMGAVALLAPLASVQAQAPAGEAPVDVAATIQSATAQRDYAMLDKTAEAAVRARNFEAAEQLIQASLKIRTDVGGAGGALYAEGLVKYADLEKWQSRNGSAEAKYKEALTVLKSGPEAARALLSLGAAAFSREELPVAADYFNRAERAFPGTAPMAKMWQAIVKEKENNVADADALYSQARSLVNPKSRDAAVIGKLHSKFLLRQNRKEEATAAAEASAEAVKANAAKPDTGGAHRIGGETKPPKLVEKVEPEYTEEARAAKLDGTAKLGVVIGVDGRAHNITVLAPLGLGLDEKAIDAISQWRFSPGTIKGEPVAVFATIEVNFKLM